MLPKFEPNEIKVVYLRRWWWELNAMSTLAPKISLSAKKVSDDIAKATGDRRRLEISVKLTIQNGQPQMEVVPFASSLVMKAIKEQPRDRKKQKKIKHRENINFYEIVDITCKKQHRYLARELPGTLKDILGTLQSVNCNGDGCHSFYIT
ncbi:PREDICTED: 60S ribosomal protein L12-like [Elephantulus edwardii]|uniref:60S ribosomal protein L12-like n=1 Tax=Elephantulus edwardii TaxID=28737 RepID=UPI0003F0D305|nr:PREDICTED: 60S ribosomal protein L12-like [Elephantulus edwardii]